MSAQWCISYRNQSFDLLICCENQIFGFCVKCNTAVKSTRKIYFQKHPKTYHKRLMLFRLIPWPDLFLFSNSAVLRTNLLYVNPFFPYATFLYLLKTTENRAVF